MSHSVVRGSIETPVSSISPSTHSPHGPPPAPRSSGFCGGEERAGDQVSLVVEDAFVDQHVVVNS
jgi:hypothetical protein